MESIRETLIDKIGEPGIVDNLILRDYYQDKFQKALEDVKKIETSYSQAMSIYNPNITLLVCEDRRQAIVSCFLDGMCKEIYVRVHDNPDINLLYNKYDDIILASTLFGE